METKNFRNLFVAGMAVVSMISTNDALAKNKPTPSMEGNNLVTTNQHRSIETRIAHIDNHEARIKELRTARKQACKAGNKDEAAFYKSELKKEYADLRWDKSYLEAEKDVYVYGQKQDIKSAKDVKSDRKKELRMAKRTLRRDIRKGNEETLVENAQKLAFLERAVNSDQARIDFLEDQHDTYVAYLKQEIKDADGETNA